jgi:hypothetical protein
LKLCCIAIVPGFRGVISGAVRRLPRGAYAIQPLGRARHLAAVFEYLARDPDNEYSMIDSIIPVAQKGASYKPSAARRSEH